MFENNIVTLLALALIGFGLAVGAIHGTVKRQKKEARGKENDNYSFAISILEAVRDDTLDADHPTDHREAQSEKSKKLIRDPHRLVAIWTEALTKWTAVLVLAAIIAAIFAYATLNAIRGQLDEMRLERRPWAALAMSITTPLENHNGNWGF